MAEGVQRQILRKLVARRHRAIHDMARRAMAIADQFLAHDGFDAVAADQCDAAILLAVLIAHARTLVVDIDVLDARVGVKVDVRFGLHLFEDREMNVRAMNDGIGIFEACAEIVAGLDQADHAFVDRIHHQQFVVVDGARPRTRSAAQRVHGSEGIGSKLDAGADFADLRRLFDEFDIEPAWVKASAQPMPPMPPPITRTVLSCTAIQPSLTVRFFVSVHSICIQSISRPGRPAPGIGYKRGAPGGRHRAGEYECGSP